MNKLSDALLGKWGIIICFAGMTIAGSIAPHAFYKVITGHSVHDEVNTNTGELIGN